MRIAVALFGVAVLALLAPLIWSALSGEMSLAALGAIGIAGTGLFQAMPLAGQRIEHRLLDSHRARQCARLRQLTDCYLAEQRQHVAACKEAVGQLGAADAHSVLLCIKAEKVLTDLSDLVNELFSDLRAGCVPKRDGAPLDDCSSIEAIPALLGHAAFTRVRDNLDHAFAELAAATATPDPALGGRPDESVNLPLAAVRLDGRDN